MKNMEDPTYNKAEISRNPAWAIAFIISECINDMAPIGWSKFIFVADEILKAQSKGKRVDALEAAEKKL